MRRPVIGFVGLGWIGRARLRSVVESGLAEAAFLADPDPLCRREARLLAPGAWSGESLEELLAAAGCSPAGGAASRDGAAAAGAPAGGAGRRGRAPLEGVVIATPSALHAGQAVRCLQAGLPVFCQKPLGRSAGEVRGVVEEARAAGRLLGVDLSYRFTRGMQAIHGLLRAGELGRVYAVDLRFHNAYGPDKSWFYDRARSGGGCLLDLGIHLVDLVLWALDFPAVRGAAAQLSRAGQRVRACPQDDAVEDYAAALLDLEPGTTVSLACSWRLPAGQQAVIEASFYGSRGGAALRNVDGSFHDFSAWRFDGTSRSMLARPPDDWGAGAILDWVGGVGRGGSYDPTVERAVEVAALLDRLYGRAG